MSLATVTKDLVRPKARGITTLSEYAAALANYDLSPYLGQPITQTLAGEPVEEMARNFAGVAAQAAKDNGVVFACLLVRSATFSAARFRWQRLRDGKPSDTFGSPQLRVLERPWVGGTTQDLLARMIQDADLAGNAFVVNVGGELVRLRPDWVYAVVARRMLRGGQLGLRKMGYIYQEGGIHSDAEPVPFEPFEMCHFMPMPDPEAPFRGMSWITSVAREIVADKVMQRHKQKFFENGATPNMVIRHAAGANEAKVRRWVAEMAAEHGGVENAYKNLNLYPGADVTVVGNNFQQVDFKVVQGAGETRIAAAAGVPPIIVGLSEGLQSATYSNYGQARRRYGDGTAHPLWQNASGSMEPLVDRAALANGGGDIRLWYDVSDVPFLREDAKDAADIAQVRAATVRTYVDSGFTAESAIKAVEADDIRLLEHTGLFSVQLRPPGEEGPPPEEAPPDGAPPDGQLPKGAPAPGAAGGQPEQAGRGKVLRRGGSSPRHLPGKHDQKTHGHGGGGADEDYQGQHRPADANYGAPMSDTSSMFPDLLEHPEWYSTGDPDIDAECMAAIRKAAGNPDAEIDIYRAVPNDAPDKINDGDWVTPSRTYADRHGQSNLGGYDNGVDWEPLPYKILHEQARAGDLYTEGNWLPEWGWDPPGERAAAEVLAARHLPGKHNQATHGHGGGSGALPQGWSKSTAEAERASLLADEGLSGPEAETMARVAIPGSMFCYRSDDGRVAVLVDPVVRATDEDLSALMSDASDLQARFPTESTARIFVDRVGALGPGVGGETVARGKAEIRLSDTAVRSATAADPWSIHAKGYITDRRRYTLAHEWGHATDTLPDEQRQALFEGAKMLGTSEYGAVTGEEALAEALADYVVTEPGARLGSTQLYADALGWGSAPTAAARAWEALEGFERHLPGKHNQKTHGHGGGKGATTHVRPITRDQLSNPDTPRTRAVSAAEFQSLAAEGKARLAGFRDRASPTTGLDENWDGVKAQAFADSRETWGGSTIDAHTGKFLTGNEDAYALTVKPPGMASVSIPAGASREEFDAAMGTARDRFGDLLTYEGFHLGVFNDGDLGRIDIDPVLVVKSHHDVETIGSYTHSVGGGYHFKSGDGFWPPYVESGE